MRNLSPTLLSSNISRNSYDPNIHDYETDIIIYILVSKLSHKRGYLTCGLLSYVHAGSSQRPQNGYLLEYEAVVILQRQVLDLNKYVQRCKKSTNKDNLLPISEKVGHLLFNNRLILFGFMQITWDSTVE